MIDRPGTRHQAVARNDLARLAEAVRSACLDAAQRAHEEAGISGLCGEGRWECAIGAIRTLDLATLVAQFADTPDDTA